MSLGVDFESKTPSPPIACSFSFPLVVQDLNSQFSTPAAMPATHCHDPLPSKTLILLKP